MLRASPLRKGFEAVHVPALASLPKKYGAAAIGIIGAGHIGGTLARHFVDAGHEVALSNSRAPATLEDLVDELGVQA
ncbi:MAG TPA: NAD(P)-binding domain-containing protein [Gaiellaceae bacterium]|nr:NAD(P)-binding domain-containing protein [Gaiellaceae bacterium]